MSMMKWRGGAGQAGEDQNYGGNDVFHLRLLIALAGGVVSDEEIDYHLIIRSGHFISI
jgi:hypothetical protein